MGDLPGALDSIIRARGMTDLAAIAACYAQALVEAGAPAASVVLFGSHRAEAGVAGTTWTTLLDRPHFRSEIPEEPALPSDVREVVVRVCALAELGWELHLERLRCVELRSRLDEGAHAMRNAANNVHLQLMVLDQLAERKPVIDAAGVRGRVQRGVVEMRALVAVIERLEGDNDAARSQAPLGAPVTLTGR